MENVIILQLTYGEADELEDLLLEREAHLTDAQESVFAKVSDALDAHHEEE